MSKIIKSGFAFQDGLILRNGLHMKNNQGFKKFSLKASLKNKCKILLQMSLTNIKME